MNKSSSPRTPDKPGKEQADTARKPGGNRRRSVTRVSDLTSLVADRAIRRQGFAQAAVVSRWKEIVGPEFARYCLPVKLSFPAGQRRGGTLTVQVDGPFALHLAHVQAQVIERVNRFFGYAAVERLALRQGPVPDAAALAETEAAPLAPQEAKVLEEAVRNVKDRSLADALERLGRLVLSRPKACG
ncbi:DUF721 domain-containing protein [Pedomonas mirosovicensis]|uniref:DUF721 domain-containing protein n=1 Tax=Pedomonas mirosovicensis TaxID=2908641 RepID=UPI002169A9A9|nr:DciA family protein [Pedomonas mirosovicensis]MCH8685652.1 DciA family protein [Pedomonas mirosovicensis]